MTRFLARIRTTITATLTIAATSAAATMGNPELLLGQGRFAVGSLNVAVAYRDTGISMSDIGLTQAATRKNSRNEPGIRRLDVNADQKASSNQLALGFAYISDDKNSQVMKQNLSLTSSRYSIRASFLDVDQAFGKFSELTDTDKQQIISAKGTRRMDLTGTFNIAKGLSMESYFGSSTSKSDGISSRQFKNTLSYTAKSGMKITAFRDDSTTNTAQGSGYVRQSLSLDHKLNVLGGLGISLSRNVDAKQTAQGQNSSTVTNQFHVETDKQKPNWLALDSKSVRSGSGGFENTRSLNFAVTPSKTLNMTGNMFSTNGNNGDMSGRNLSVKWAPNANLNLSANMTDKSGTNIGKQSVRNYSVSGVIAENTGPIKNLNITANQSTETHNGQTAKASRYMRLAGQLPNVGALKNIHIQFDQSANRGFNVPTTETRTFKMNSDVKGFSIFKSPKVAYVQSSEERDGKQFRDGTSIRFDSPTRWGSTSFEYSSQQEAGKPTVSTRGFTFASDPNASKKTSVEVIWKERNLGNGNQIGIRGYSITHKMSDKTCVTWNYFRNREKPDGRIEPLSGSEISLATQLGSCSLSANYRKDTNLICNTDRDVYGVQMKTKLKNGATLETGYAKDSSANCDSSAYHIKYDRKVSEDNYISLTGEMKTTDSAAAGAKRDSQARIEFRKLFH